MDRRIFITRLPSVMIGCTAALLSPVPEDTPERRELRERLDHATRLYDQARNLLHWPWRYGEAIPLLENALDASARVWLILRGVHTRERNHSWSFTACNFRDETTGVGWNCARVTCNLLDCCCLHMGRWYGPSGTRKNGQDRGIIVERARRDLTCALDAVSQCLECTRHALDGLTGSLPPLPKTPRV